MRTRFVNCDDLISVILVYCEDGQILHFVYLTQYGVESDPLRPSQRIISIEFSRLLF